MTIKFYNHVLFTVRFYINYHWIPHDYSSRQCFSPLTSRRAVYIFYCVYNVVSSFLYIKSKAALLLLPCSCAWERSYYFVMQTLTRLSQGRRWPQLDPNCRIYTSCFMFTSCTKQFIKCQYVKKAWLANILRRTTPFKTCHKVHGSIF